MTKDPGTSVPTPEQIEMARRVGDRENDEAVEALVRESNMIEGITSTTSRHYSAG